MLRSGLPDPVPRSQTRKASDSGTSIATAGGSADTAAAGMGHVYELTELLTTLPQQLLSAAGDGLHRLLAAASQAWGGGGVSSTEAPSGSQTTAELHDSLVGPASAYPLHASQDILSACQLTTVCHSSLLCQYPAAFV